MVGEAIAVLFRSQDLAFSGLVSIRVIKGGPKGFHKGASGCEGEFPGTCIHVGLELGSGSPREVGRGIGDFA